MILDSGNRQQFFDKDGKPLAVRDVSEGKGRCDLLPLDTISEYLRHNGSHNYAKIISDIHEFTVTSNTDYLLDAVRKFTESHLLWDGYSGSMILDYAKHLEEGCKKYGANNWKLGIPVYRYVDSGVRHLLKHMRGDTDEPHDRAFVFNMLGCVWTCKHIPELNDYKKEGGSE